MRQQIICTCCWGIVHWRRCAICGPIVTPGMKKRPFCSMPFFPNGRRVFVRLVKDMRGDINTIKKAQPSTEIIQAVQNGRSLYQRIKIRVMNCQPMITPRLSASHLFLIHNHLPHAGRFPITLLKPILANEGINGRFRMHKNPKRIPRSP